MTRVIRDRKGLYLLKGGAWTASFEDAKKFPDMWEALFASRQFHLTGVEVVLVVGDEPSKWDLVLPQDSRVGERDTSGLGEAGLKFAAAGVWVTVDP